MKKLLCSMMVAIVFLLSPLSAFASTTESMMRFNASIRSIPSNHTVVFSPALFNKDNNSYSTIGSFSASDNQVNFGSYSYSLTDSRIHNYQYGFIVDYDYPSGYTVIYNDQTINIDLSGIALWVNKIANEDSWDAPLTLSPYAIPSQAYVIYEGQYDFQIYDGSTGYERFVYDNNFTIAKSAIVSLSNFGLYNLYSTGNFNSDQLNGFDLSLSAPMLTKGDLLSDEVISNHIADYNNYLSANSLLEDSVLPEDIVTDFMRFDVQGVKFIVFYEFNDTNFVYYYDPSSSYYLLSDLDYTGLTLSSIIFPSPYNNNSINVDVYSNASSDSSLMSSLRVLSTGFSESLRSLGSGMSSIVTNATDNANRIIQNTTNKINEVKQGVTEVKDSVIETKNSILDLPNKIKDMLLGLIVPSSETMSNKFSEFSELLEEKLGIIYQVPMMLFDFFDTIVNAATTPQTTLTLPAFQLPWIDGTTLTVWQPMEYRIIPEGMQVLSDLIKTITSMTVVVLTFNSVKRAYERFLRS